MMNRLKNFLLKKMSPQIKANIKYVINFSSILKIRRIKNKLKIKSSFKDFVSNNVFVYVSGRLGNKIIMYALKKRIEKENIGVKVFFISPRNMEMENIFNIPENELIDDLKIAIPLLILLSFYYLKEFTLKEKECERINDEEIKEFKCFHHFSFPYPEDIIKLKKDDNYRFRDVENKLSEENKIILNKIRNCNSVSLHVRRTDYLFLQDLYPVLTFENYYKYAIKEIQHRVENPHYFVFSDDIKWCKNNIKLENADFISSENPAHVDMFLMSNCKHKIIANSTFSYCAAMLSDIEDSVVIAPKNWFQVEPGNSHALKMLPANWVVLSMKENIK